MYFHKFCGSLLLKEGCGKSLDCKKKKKEKKRKEKKKKKNKPLKNTLGGFRSV
jgi:hypothetical protein